MKYTLMAPADRAALWDGLGSMPDFLLECFGALSREDAARSAADGGFSPVEQCWHLADLEQDGFNLRIRRLMDEDTPHLADFDGARVARERDYLQRSVAEGIERFRLAREANIAMLRAAGTGDWQRAATQEGVGPVHLCDLPVMMAEHDAAHRAEILAWCAGVTGHDT